MPPPQPPLSSSSQPPPPTTNTPAALSLLSSASNDAHPPSLSVSAERKRALLLEARRDRVEWIDSSSGPFRGERGSSVDECMLTGGGVYGNEALDVLTSVRACSTMTSAVEVARALYCSPAPLGGMVASKEVAAEGMSEGDGGIHGAVAPAFPASVGDRIKWLLENEIREEVLQKAMMSPSSFSSSRSFPSAKRDEPDENLPGRHSTGTKAPPVPTATSTSTACADRAFLSSYRHFLHRLRAPECADLIQATRRFVHAFEDAARDAAAAASDKRAGVGGEEDATERLASMMRNYLAKSFEAFRSHPQWRAETTGKEDGGNGGDGKGKNGDAALGGKMTPDELRIAIETFFYAKCHAAIRSYLLASLADDADTDDDAFQKRLDDLQFVTPAHLDIHCLAGRSIDENGAETRGASSGAQAATKHEPDPWMRLFAAPIRALQSVENQYAPSRMLSCVLDVYRGVNEALTEAMSSSSSSSSSSPVEEVDNRAVDGGGRSESRPLPSADDVLPALILVVLKAKPRGALTDLAFVESFAAPEQLRGEAGYAFTNLCGAVRFLRELDVDEHVQATDGGGEAQYEDDGNGKIPFFTISAAEFRSGLDRCRREARRRAEATMALVPPLSSSSRDRSGMRVDGGGNVASSSSSSSGPHADVCIPVHVVRSARASGEIVDLRWAREWQRRAGEGRTRTEGGERRDAAVDNDGDDDNEGRDSRNNADNYHHRHRPPPPPPLPSGFVREYSYLSIRAEDVRVCDVPDLLREYRSLVRATEALLSERTAALAEERRRATRSAREKLERDAAAFGEGGPEMRRNADRME